jgi:hypothetical protein
MQNAFCVEQDLVPAFGAIAGSAGVAFGAPQG